MFLKVEDVSETAHPLLLSPLLLQLASYQVGMLPNDNNHYKCEGESDYFDRIVSFSRLMSFLALFF